ncbi:hypothetical protein HanHA300_Chr13g0465661 [Helianthus annuus]|uniref:uncharacterized protein LOC110900493 n=1 Tax=Helianthus annuus TaxID=4232 RepID=UPI000B905123|nr:uncharacterized protein LOC110900493 [Helianthus annuus]KAJ0475457.1 hypothetical protein HanHA300_Chr13g0465661 [Helianthus annuus]KAJ0496267.1 hypothetical protein HanHA89_Chr13g0497741 [Helianthus annuus]
MENTHRQKAKSTGDMFTFPFLSKGLELESELADQLFANGRFRIHAFPVQPTNFLIPKSVILSRTSSFSSKGSLLSSRSNSTSTNSISNSNSKSKSKSSCRSARRSINEATPRKKLLTIHHARSVAVKSTNTYSNSSSKSNSSARTSTSEVSSRRKLLTISHAATNTSNKVGTKEWQTRTYGNEYGHSHRWQFISPVPSFNKRKGGKGKGKGDADDRKGVCRRFLGWLVSTCQECHAIEPSKRLEVSM